MRNKISFYRQNLVSTKNQISRVSFVVLGFCHHIRYYWMSVLYLHLFGKNKSQRPVQHVDSKLAQVQYRTRKTQWEIPYKFSKSPGERKYLKKFILVFFFQGNQRRQRSAFNPRQFLQKKKKEFVARRLVMTLFFFSY